MSIDFKKKDYEDDYHVPFDDIMNSDNNEIISTETEINWDEMNDELHNQIIEIINKYRKMDIRFDYVNIGHILKENVKYKFNQKLRYVHNDIIFKCADEINTIVKKYMDKSYNKVMHHYGSWDKFYNSEEGENVNFFDTYEVIYELHDLYYNLFDRMITIEDTYFVI